MVLRPQYPYQGLRQPHASLGTHAANDASPHRAIQPRKHDAPLAAQLYATVHVGEMALVQRRHHHAQRPAVGGNDLARHLDGPDSGHLATQRLAEEQAVVQHARRRQRRDAGCQMHTDVVTLHQAHMLAARAIGVKVAADEPPIAPHERQLRQDVRHHARFVGDAHDLPAVEPGRLDPAPQPQHGLVHGVEDAQRVLLQRQGRVGVLPHLRLQRLLPLPAQQPGDGHPPAQEHQGAERTGDDPVDAARPTLPAAPIRDRFHCSAAGMVSV